MRLQKAKSDSYQERKHMKKITLTTDTKTVNRKYMLGQNWSVFTNGTIKTPQARKCCEFIQDALKVLKTDRVPELEMRKIVESRGTELKTKQEPWHIFMYYRPALIQMGILKYAPEEKPEMKPVPAK